MPAIHSHEKMLSGISNEPRRAVVANVWPQLESGRFAIKRVIGDQVVVRATVLVDGHDLIACEVKHRHQSWPDWRETPCVPLEQDDWQAEFTVEEIGRYQYYVEAWVDAFRTWRRNLEKRHRAGKNVAVELLTGADLLRTAAQQATAEDAETLLKTAEKLAGPLSLHLRVSLALEPVLAALMHRYAPRRYVSRSAADYEVVVDRPCARYSTWYETFPRSCGSAPHAHGTLRDLIERLPYVREMGFDVLYLPPIHPIGRTHRKGRNNATEAAPSDPGSPWGIGGEEGGHKDIHPRLGTLEEFRALVAAVRELGMELALDIAFQCSPDHPYVKLHPEWFRHRPDGSIQYAENPPKEYQDIYPFDFECDAWRSLWDELLSVVLFWVQQGVGIFRVDNPHTKPFAFWQWLIDRVKFQHPHVLFLSEAFTRPNVMFELAKLGFTQSYTYFTWRNSKRELTQFFAELSKSPVREYFRPNLWPNTPDILPEFLQAGGRTAFQLRLVLAATLGANYGIYGPAYELCEHRPREPGSEEYLDSEKYEIRHWDLAQPHSLRAFIATINRIRQENPALQRDDTLEFHKIENEQLIAYSKQSLDGANIVLAVVNLDPGNTQGGTLELSLDKLGLCEDGPYPVTELFSGDQRVWHGRRQFVELNPQHLPARLFAIRNAARSERDFEYFL